jgi:hypothetical protein
MASICTVVSYPAKVGEGQTMVSAMSRLKISNQLK